MAIVSCPDCGKKLKIADTSVGKKVKCSCGHVFVAAAEAAAPPAPVALPDKVVVACTECGSKLKVAATSLGKKMKCPKCAGVFIASASGPIAPPPPKIEPPKDDDEDDLMSFAQADVQKEARDEEEDLFRDDEEPKPRAKGKPSWKAGLEDEDLPKAKGKPPRKRDEDEEDAPRPKAKFGAKKAAKPSRLDEDDEDRKPVYPSRLLVNILVFLLAFSYITVFALVFLDVVKLPIDKPKARTVILKAIPTPDKIKDKEADKDKAKDKEADKDKTKDKDKAKDKDNGKDKDADKDKDKKEAAKLNGSWIVESAVTNGKLDDKMAGESFVFADGKVTGLGPDPAPYTVNVSDDPKSIAITIPAGPPGKVMTVTVLYKIEEEKLHLCLSNDPKQRPTSFDAKDAVLILLRRATKDNTQYGRAGSMNNLKQIALAIHNFHDANKHFPPAASSGADDPTGKPLLSWRVAILPYIEQGELYQEFDLNLPWDDPHNQKLIAKMPKIFVVPGVEAKEGMTHYRTLVGPGTVLEPKKDPDGKLTAGTMIGITDGTSNTVMVVEATEPTIWTKPDDLPYDPKGPLPKFGVAPSGFNVALADGTVRFVRSSVPEDVLRPYLTGNNGMPRAPLEPDKDKGKDKDADKDKAKDKVPLEAAIAAAKAQLALLTKASLTYLLKNAEYPKTLNDLVESEPPYLESKDALLDPWKKPYQYDPKGPKNNGAQPDIWTVTPDKEVIGNWPKKKDKGKGKDDKDKDKDKDKDLEKAPQSKDPDLTRFYESFEERTQFVLQASRIPFPRRW